MPVRFNLDENISTSIAACLRRRGIDLTTTAEAGLLGADDAAQLAFAASQGRVMVTRASVNMWSVHEIVSLSDQAITNAA